MRWWVYVLIAIAVGLGTWKHFIVFDPLNLVVLGALLWTQYAAMARQQQLADLVSHAQKVSATNDKVLSDKMAEIKAEVHRLK